MSPNEYVRGYIEKGGRRISVDVVGFVVHRTNLMFSLNKIISKLKFNRTDLKVQVAYSCIAFHSDLETYDLKAVDIKQKDHYIERVLELLNER